MTDRAESPPSLHRGPEHSAPYPVSRLAPAFHSPDLAAAVAQAELLLDARTSARLQVIADQMRALQQAARPDDTGALVDQLLRVGGLRPGADGNGEVKG